MYTLGSTEFNQIIETPNNQSVKKRLVLLDNGTIIDKIKSLTLYGSSSSQELQLGTTNMAYIEAEVDSDLLLTNREVRLECGVTLSDGSEEYIPMGVFTIQKPQGDIDFVKFKAHDNMQKFEKVYSSELTYPTTSDLVLDEICNMCGVMLSTPIENPIEITEKLQGYTCREVLGFIAGIHGKFACIDRLGTLNLRWYSETPIDKQIGLIWAFNKSDDDFTVDKIEIAKDTETNYTSGSGFSAIYHSNPLATQEITDDLFAKLDGFTYNASTIDILDDIRLDIWDVIKVIYLDGKEYLVPCMSLKQDFGQGSTSIQSFAKTNTENEYRYNGAMTNYANRIAMELLLTNRIVATKVDAEYVNSVAITTENFEAKVAEIKELVVEEIDGKYATIDFANIDVANINKTNIGLLFAEVGLLDRATIVDGHVTGFLDAVEINANKITAGTLIADRLLLRGSAQSILYQLNSLSRNLLPYPYYMNNRVNRGITFEDYDGKGGIKANGTGDGTGQPHFICELYTVQLKANQPYTFASNCSDNRGFITIWFRTVDGSGITMDYTEIRNGVTKTVNGNSISELKGGVICDGITFIPSQDMYMQFDLRFDTNVGTVTDAIFYPMICEGTEVIPYEPYRERTQALTSETINGEVLTDRTITADKIIAKSITTNELDVDKIFGNEAVLNKIVSQEIFSDAVATNRVVVGKADSDEIIAENMLPYPYTETTHAQYGVTWTDLGDGTVKANGTNTETSKASQFYFNTDTSLDLKPNTTYTLSGCPSGGATSTYRIRIIINYKKDGQVQYSDVGNGVTFTTPSNYTDCRIMIDVNSGVTVNNLIFKPMLEKGSVAHAYQPYVMSRQGLVEQMVADNLLIYPYVDTTRTNVGITFTDLGNGQIRAKGTQTAGTNFRCRSRDANVDKNQLILPKGTYTISGCPSGGSLTTYYLQAGYTGDNGSWASLGNDYGEGVTFTLTKDTAIQLLIIIDDNCPTIDVIFKPMIEVGTVVHPYREYSKGGTGIANNLYREGTTLIDGNKIYTGSILADSIDINDLFADTAFIDALRTNSIIVGIGNKADTALSEVNKTVKSITMHYLATTASSGVTTSTSGWTTTVQQINATKKYLWTYQTITYVDNTTTNTNPVISGVYGNEGKDGKDGQNGQDGKDGKDGINGTNGTNGTNGVGVTSVIPLYYLKSNTTAPTAPTSAVTSTSTGSGVWTKSVPTYVANYTYFTCTQTKYTDNTYSWSTVVADNALTNANKTANTANTNASNAVTTANTANTTANTANSTATTANNTANAIKNNIYKSGTTLIDGGKIFTGTVTAEQIDVDNLFAKNINMTGTFTATSSAWIRPSWEDTKIVSDYYFAKKEEEATGKPNPYSLTDAQKKAFDFNMNGEIDLQDCTVCKMFSINPEKTLQDAINNYGYEPIETELSVVIKPDNPDKIIEVIGTNSFGREIDIYFGTLGMSVPSIRTNGISCAGITAQNDINCVEDVYANYGLDTQVSLLGLQEKVNYLQPHGYSLIRYTDIGELTTTQKIYTLFNNRKMSDYGMLLITIGVSATDIRETMYVPTLVFSGSDALPRTLYLECWTDNGATFNQVRIDYVSDTQIKAYLVTSTTKTKYLNIYGVKVDAALSGRSVDLI